MNETEIEQFKHTLLSLRSELQNLEEATALDQAALDSLSRMDAMQAQKTVEEPARQRKRQLGKIEGAFRRIEAGEYGNCFMCGEEIDICRLSTDPTNTRCVKCAES